MTGYRVGVDIGGTFTDIVFLGANGQIHTKKVPSSVNDYARAIMAGIDEVFADTGLTADDIREIRHGTTVASNAILEHAGARTGLITSKGFRDILATLRDFLAEYQQPVVCIHGDSHYFRIDKPFHDEAGTQYLHFTRMEVFGAPTVAGVIVNVDPTDPQVFSYRPYYMDNN